MQVNKYKASEPLNNNAEQEHYNNGRSFFAQMGASQENIDKAKAAFANFEDVVEKSLEGLKKKGFPAERVDRMIEKIKKERMLSNERAVELIDLAVKDHKVNYGTTKSDSWPRA